MYLRSLPILLIMYLASGVLSASLFAPCKVSDSSCLEQTVNAALPRILTGIPELGVDSADPLFNDIIEENLPKLKLILFNSTVTGFKDCRLSNITFNEDMTSVRCNAYCPSFHLHGQYDISGQLILLPIQGNGDFTFHTGLFLVTVDTQLEKIKGNDGKTHFVIKKFKVDSVPTKPIIYEFTNLFNGKKEQADAIHKFAHDNWLKITKLIQYPIWYKSLDTLSKSVNKYLEYVAVEDSLI